MDVQYVFSGYESEQCKPEEVFGPENKRECPCDTCPLYDTCLENITECSAMRNWCSKGDYADKDIQRLVRACSQKVLDIASEVCYSYSIRREALRPQNWAANDNL